MSDQQETVASGSTPAEPKYSLSQLVKACLATATAVCGGLHVIAMASGRAVFPVATVERWQVDAERVPGLVTQVAELRRQAAEQHAEAARVPSLMTEIAGLRQEVAKQQAAAGRVPVLQDQIAQRDAEVSRWKLSAARVGDLTLQVEEWQRKAMDWESRAREFAREEPFVTALEWQYPSDDDEERRVSSPPAESDAFHVMWTPLQQAGDGFILKVASTRDPSVARTVKASYFGESFEFEGRLWSIRLHSATWTKGSGRGYGLAGDGPVPSRLLVEAVVAVASRSSRWPR